MSARITYYLGAGASYHSIPTVKDLWVRMKIFYEMVPVDTANGSKYTGRQQITYEKLLKEIKDYGTPDTLARNYYLTRNPKLLDLKNLLSCYIIFEQLSKNLSLVNSSVQMLSKKERAMKSDLTIDENTVPSLLNTLDRRYTSLFATILDIEKKQLKLPPNINFISWNYDSQLERAFQDFCEPNTPYEDVQAKLNVIPRLASHNESFRKKSFNVIKLNGTGGFASGEYSDILFDFYRDERDIVTWQIFSKILFSEESDLSNRLFFAWEEKDKNDGFIVDLATFHNLENDYKGIKSARRIAADIMRQSDTVVVIGYSFPDFNREIDKQIFSGFNGKLIIQDPDADNIVQKIKGVNQNIKKERIEVITDTSNFFIPYEYWE